MRDGEVVDERRLLSEQGVGDDAEGVFEENDGSQLGGVDERRRVQARSAAEASGRVRACWRPRVSRGLDGRSFVVRESLGAAAGAHGSDVLAIAGPVDVDEDGVHGEPVEDGGGDGIVAEVAAPFSQINSGCDGGGEFAMPAIDEMKRVCAAVGSSSRCRT